MPEAPYHELAKLFKPDQVLTREADLLVYDADGLTHFRRKPKAVVLPTSTEEVSKAVRWCHAHKIPFVPRGAGTGLSGGALPCENGIIIEMARLDRVLAVNRQDLTARLQTGVINLELSQAVGHLDLFYAPDPSSQSACTIGGNIAENSGGPHCMKYGMTTQHILALTVVLPNGDVVELGSPCAEVPGYDWVGLFVGSEGTFGIATEATVRLTPVPPAVRLLFLAFPSLEGACRAVSAMVAEGVQPAALEMLDQKTIEVVEDSIFAAGLPRQAGAVLLAELDGLWPQVNADTEHVKRIAQEFAAFEMREAEDLLERTKLWKGRKAAFGALGRLKPDLYVQDAVVPRSKLPEVLKKILEIADRHDVLLSNVLHAGDGNLHPNISYDGRDEHELGRVKKAGQEILQTCIDVGGALSGEHGIGREKRDFMPMLFADVDLALFSQIRSAFNPLGLCNPDKVLPGTKVCMEFRQGTSVNLKATP